MINFQDNFYAIAYISFSNLVLSNREHVRGAQRWFFIVEISLPVAQQCLQNLSFPCTNEEVNFRNALLLRFVFLLVEVGLIDKCHLSYKQKLLGTEEYIKGTHKNRYLRQYMLHVEK